ncbi:cytochrome P450 [Amycolatopsis acidiphila]|uniref:Cytochrome P450 n=1 Tax=Amycolatopsis acidiphila TaxID=715473 RepID=A0A558AI12_9PSEU|nr:cytochrome P450 [Amycolatopsis acidiphila]TVT23900.1 cytochrome P450 [Amycolatopsis acidiphila]UIJ61124.1 cytochrome P450 [Amycolatopsis acidiphila]GHG86586.1 cytochrome P450 [Amycolatopsis acidiphila]
MKDQYLLSPELISDPYPYFAQLRSTDPVHWNERHRAWFLSRYADVVGAFRSPDLTADRIKLVYEKQSSSRKEDLKRTFDLIRSKWFGYMDPPEHTRLRKLVQKSFSPEVVRRLEDQVDAACDGLADRLHGDLNTGEPIDFMEVFARPLPAYVIADMLGVPREDREQFEYWSSELVLMLFGALGSPDRVERTHAAMMQLEEYFQGLVRLYEGRPADNVISHLLRAEEEGRVLNRDEITATCIMLLTAGDHTTASLLGNTVLALSNHPDQLDKLRARPELVPQAVEEFVRFEGPLKVTVRVAAREHTLHGRTIREGDRVYLLQGAANRDPEQFSDPDKLDVERQGPTHVGFGHGIHFCLGSAVARMTARVAIRALLTRMPRFEVNADSVQWEPYMITRSLQSLQIRAVQPTRQEVGA